MKNRFPLMAELRAERKRRKLWLIDFAWQVGYHPTTIARWERGEDYPSIAALEDWCAALGKKLVIYAQAG